jgi:hypothetical protein
MLFQSSPFCVAGPLKTSYEAYIQQAATFDYFLSLNYSRVELCQRSIKQAVIDAH